ncbi:MAG: hypothetical protein ACR2NT_07565 [Acidimicrobiia bacterium]
MRFAGIVAGIAWAWSLPKLLREWELAGQGQLFTFAISSLVCAPIWWMFRKAEPASQAATRVVRFGTGLIVVSLLVMAGVTQILAFTFFALAAGALLTALGFLAGRKRIATGAVLAFGAMCFLVGALFGSSPVGTLPVSILAASFGLATALAATPLRTHRGISRVTPPSAISDSR